MEELSAEVWGLFISSFISSTIAPGGSEAILAYLVSEKHNNISLLVLVATVGNTLGALTTWGLGSLAAKKYPVEDLLTKKKRKSLELVKKWGGWAMFFSWLPIVGDGLCFAGGWLRLSLFFSVIAIFIGKAVRYTLVSYVFL